MAKAHFVTCSKCKRHGRIIASDGFYGPEVYSREFAQAMVVAGVGWRKIKPQEVSDLNDEIRDSSIPSLDKDVKLEFKTVVNLWNMARQGGWYVHDTDPCEFLKKEMEKII